MSAPRDDGELVQRMLAGDQTSFDAFFDLYFPRLFRFAVSRMANEDEAEAMVQRTLVAAVRKLATWRGEAALFTWLCTICRRELSAHWKVHARTPEMHTLDDDPEIRGQLESLVADIDGPDPALERREIAGRVQLALDLRRGRAGDAVEGKT